MLDIVSTRMLGQYGFLAKVKKTNYLVSVGCPLVAACYGKIVANHVHTTYLK